MSHAACFTAPEQKKRSISSSPLEHVTSALFHSALGKNKQKSWLKRNKRRSHVPVRSECPRISSPERNQTENTSKLLLMCTQHELNNATDLSACSSTEASEQTWPDRPNTAIANTMPFSKKKKITLTHECSQIMQENPKMFGIMQTLFSHDVPLALQPPLLPTEGETKSY